MAQFVFWTLRQVMKYLCVRPEALCCPYFHTPTLYSIFLVVEPFEDEGSLGWAGEHPHCTGAHRSPLHPNSDIEEHKRAEIPGLPDRRLHYAHSPALYDLSRHGQTNEQPVTRKIEPG